MDRQEQCLKELRAQRPKNGEMIAEGYTCLARDNCLESSTLSFIRSLIYDDLAFAVSLFDFVREYTD
jgi:hypothetical protein